MGKNSDSEGGGRKIVAQNRRARFDYHIIETFEAGIVLTGAEVKSIRAGGVSINEAYVRADRGEAFVYSAHINPYSHQQTLKSLYNPTRPRKLLLHKHQIKQISDRVERQALTVVPLSLYFKHGRAKLEVAIVKAKLAPDKRAAVKERDTQREIAKAMRGKPPRRR